jgi:hypothetical protein
VIGLADREIRVAGQDPQDVVLRLLDTMVGEEDSLVTLYYGDTGGSTRRPRRLLAETSRPLRQSGCRNVSGVANPCTIISYQ